MAKFEKLYCERCGEHTIHKKVGKKAQLDGSGPARALVAVYSFGLSEFVGADYFYECTDCGKIRKD